MPLAATGGDLEGIMLSAINQRKILYDITHTWSLKNTTSKQKRSRVTKNIQVVTSGERGKGASIGWEGKKGYCEMM